MSPGVADASCIQVLHVSIFLLEQVQSLIRWEIHTAVNQH